MSIQPASILVVTDPAQGMPYLLSSLWSEGLAHPELSIDPEWFTRNREKIDPGLETEFRFLRAAPFSPEQFLPYFPFLVERLRSYGGTEPLRIYWTLAEWHELPDDMRTRYEQQFANQPVPQPSAISPINPLDIWLNVGPTYQEPFRQELWESMPGFPPHFRRAREFLTLQPVTGAPPACFHLSVLEEAASYCLFLLSQFRANEDFSFYASHPIPA